MDCIRGGRILTAVLTIAWSQVARLQKLVTEARSSLMAEKPSRAGVGGGGKQGGESAHRTATLESGGADGRGARRSGGGVSRSVEGGVGGDGGRGQREGELRAVAAVLQAERDGYFAQLQKVEALAHQWDALPHTPGPLITALRDILYAP